MKKYELWRTPFYRNDPANKMMHITMTGDPGSAQKIVDALNKEDLLRQIRAFGDELGRACEVTHKYIGDGRGFLKVPWLVRCCEENTPDEAYGCALVQENLEKRRQAGRQ